MPKGVISNFHVDIIFVTFVVTSFSSGSVEEAAPTDESKQTINVTILERILKLMWKILAILFQDLVRTNVIHHKILDTR